jgi:phenylacetate-CoA ligase
LRSLADLPFQAQLAEAERWPPDKLQSHQFQQIGILAEHAQRTVPFFRARFAAAGITDPRRIDRLWHRLPLLSRQEVQTAGTALHSTTVPPAHGGVLSNTTSGSTGVPVTVLGTELDARFFKALDLRILLRHGFDFTRKLAMIRWFEPDRARYPNGAVADAWGDRATFPFPTGPAVYLNILTTDVERQAEWLARHDPDYLNTNPTNLWALVEACVRRSIAVRVKRVVTTGETLHPEVRKAVREAWGAEIVDIYSAQEVGHIAVQCPEYEQYHVQGEHVLVEILNEQGEVCAPGEIGRVVVTPLRNFAMPLFRYDIGDYAEGGEPCPCGRGLPVLRRVLGRGRNMLVAPDGRRYWPFFGATFYRGIAPLTQYKFIQTSRDTIEARLVVERPLTQAEREALRTRIQMTLPCPFRIDFNFVAEIQRSPGWKYEDFISQIGE